MDFQTRSKVNHLRRRITEAGGPSPRTMLRHQVEDRQTLREILILFETNQLISMTDLASKFPEVTISTLYRWIYEGRMDSVKICGRVYVYLDSVLPVENTREGA